MTTLERLEKMEKDLTKMNGIIQLAAQGNANYPKLLQELGAIRQYATNLSANLKSVVDQFNKSMKNNMDFTQLGINRGLALEQSLTSLAKTLTAAISELVETKVLKDDAVMTRIRKMDETNERNRIKLMLDAKTIAPVDAVTATSLVVTLQDAAADGGDKKLVSEYSVLELTNQELPQEIKTLLLGKKVGENAEIKDEKGNKETIYFKILEVYELVPRKSEGEKKADAPVVTPETPTPPTTPTQENAGPAPQN